MDGRGEGEFRVLELGSNKLRAFNGYPWRVRKEICAGGFSCMGFDAVDTKEPDGRAFLRHRISQKACRIFHPESPPSEFFYMKSIVPECLRRIPDSSANHVHAHMLSGEFGERRAEDFADETHRILAKGGLLFISLDELFFSLEMANDRNGRVISVFEGMLRERFELLFRSFVRTRPEDPTGKDSEALLSEGTRLPQVILGEAAAQSARTELNGLSALFEAPLSAGKPWVFFEKFSDCATRFGQYFAIAKKE